MRKFFQFASIIVALALAIPKVGHAEVLIQQNFDDLADGALAAIPCPVGRIESWTGATADQLGTIAVAASPGGKGKSLCVTNAAHTGPGCPVAELNWPNAPALTGSLSVSFRIMTPVDGAYLGCVFVGGSWNDSAGILVLQDGKFFMRYGDAEAHVEAGTYQANQWYTVLMEFDAARRSFSVTIDGEKKASDLPWQTDAVASIAQLGFVADLKAVTTAGTQVLYVDDLLVQANGMAAASTAPAPQSSRVAANHADDIIPLPTTFPSSKSIGRTFRYGVCINTRRPGFKRALDAADKLGIDSARMQLDWGHTEPTEGNWDFSLSDNGINGLTSRGIDVEALLAFSTQWASTGATNTGNWHDWNNAAPRIEPFCTFASTVVKRYKDHVHLWEIWNEEDIDFWLSSTNEYVKLFNAASRAIYDADSTAQVMNGGLALIRRGRNPNFPEEFARDADQAHWNIWAYHDYMTYSQMIERNQQNATLYHSTGLHIPIWVNEGGFTSVLSGGEPEEAITLVKKYSIAPALGLSGYFWYDLVDDGTDPHESEHHFGLLHHDFSPKLAYAAYQTLIGQLAPLKYAKRMGDVAALPGVMGVLYQAQATDRDNVLVLWRQQHEGSSTVWVGADGDAAVASVVDMRGATVVTSNFDRGVLLKLAQEPVYVHLKGTLSPILRPVLSVPDKIALLPGEPTRFKITLLNPGSTAGEFRVSLSADQPAVQLDPAQSTLHIEPGASADIVVTSRFVESNLVASTLASKGSAIQIQVTPADGVAFGSTIPCQLAQAVPRLSDSQAVDIPAGEGLQLRLDGADSIVNLYAAQPVVDMHWHGPTDLSATAALASTDQALFLHVTVTDDVHAQSHRDAHLWEGDSLQIAVQADAAQASYLKLALALGDDGKPLDWVETVPAGSSITPGRLSPAVQYSVARHDNHTTYALRLPWRTLGLMSPPAHGFQFNFLVNDDDGKGRKQWLQLTDGIGREQNPAAFKLFECR